MKFAIDRFWRLAEVMGRADDVGLVMQSGPRRRAPQAPVVTLNPDQRRPVVNIALASPADGLARQRPIAPWTQ
jgi:hypothetical protein